MGFLNLTNAGQNVGYKVGGALEWYLPIFKGINDQGYAEWYKPGADQMENKQMIIKYPFSIMIFYLVNQQES